jgi:hydroxyethylthiazole kinase-like uncharacterized protein yjeF
MTLKRLRLADVDLPLQGVGRTRALEHRAASALPAHTLMARAGLAAARLAVALQPQARRVLVHAGPGNNGGDGAEAAHWLKRWGRDVEIRRVAVRDPLPADAAWALRRAVEAGVKLSDGDGDGHADAPALAADLHLDALLGVGVARPLEGPLARAAQALKPMASRVLALDLPTGLAADTGVADAAAVRAAWTLSLLTLKPGLLTAEGRDLAGEVWWDDLEVPGDGAEPLAWLPAMHRLASVPRPHASHKGRFGDVMVIGGAPGMAGALRLAGQAALAAGAGRVHVVTLEDRSGPARDVGLDAALMTRSPAEALDHETLARSTVLAGCGGGEAIEALLPPLLEHAARLVLDADALNAVARAPVLRSALADRGSQAKPTVLTPHPLEAARLLGCSASAVQADRLGAAQSLAASLAAVVVLKGSGTVVAAPGHTPWIVPFGNAALATAGTGDVLAGWLAGIWSGCPADAASAALQSVARHGMAADRYAATGRTGPLTATELIRWMSAARGR